MFALLFVLFIGFVFWMGYQKTKRDNPPPEDEPKIPPKE